MQLCFALCCSVIQNILVSNHAIRFVFFFKNIQYVSSTQEQFHQTWRIIFYEFNFDSFHQILQSITFILIFMLYSTITSLPWSLYETFVLEEKHGFNKQVRWFLSLSYLPTVNSFSAKFQKLHIAPAPSNFNIKAIL